MFYFRFASGQFNGPYDRHLSDRVMMHLLNALVAMNEDYLVENPKAPLLYESGVYYRRKIPKGQVDDDWNDASVCLTLGYGDCEDLACWRVAELRIRFGVSDAMPHIIRRDYDDGGWLYHIQVTARGEIEDPSEKVDYQGNFAKGRVER